MTQITKILHIITQQGDTYLVPALCLLFALWTASYAHRWLPWSYRHPVFTDLFIVLCTSVILLAPLAQPRAPGGHDIYFHLSRVAELDYLFQDGYYNGRWTPDFNYGFGYPLFNFYPSLIYYLAQPFRMLGASVADSLNWVIVSGTWLSGVFMYFLGKAFWGRYGAVLCAVAYLYIPYRIVNLYVRGAIPEFYAMTFMPLLFWIFYRIARHRKLRDVVFGAIAYGLMIPAHNVTIVFFTLCLMAYCLFLLWDSKHTDKMSWKELLKQGGYLVCTAALGVGLVTVYWLPAMSEKQFVKISSLHSGYHDVATHFVQPFQFVSRFWGYGGSGEGMRDGMSFQLGIAHLVLAAVSIFVVMLLQRRYPRQRNVLLFSLLLFACLIFAMTSGSLPIWRTLPLIGFISFPWRLLSMTGFLLSFLCGGLFLIDFDAWRVAGNTLPYKNRLLQFILIGFLLMFTAGYCKVGSPVMLTTEQLSPASIRLADGAAMNSEYLPIWSDISVKKIRDIKAGEIQIRDGDAVLKEALRQDMLSYQVTVDAQTDATLRVGILFFPGWKAYSNEEPLPIKPENPTGLLTLQLSPGIHNLVIRFEDTPIRRISRIISMGTAVLLCLLLVMPLLKRV